MNQEKLSRMCYLMNNAFSRYSNDLTIGVNLLTDWFNQNWISNSSFRLAADIYDNLLILNKEINSISKRYNLKMRKQVNDYNLSENQNLYYGGFSFEFPNINGLNNLNLYLPDGKRGMRGNDVKYPLNYISSFVSDGVKVIKNAIMASSALRYDDRIGMQNDIMNAERRFLNFVSDMSVILSRKISDEVLLSQRLNDIDF